MPVSILRQSRSGFLLLYSAFDLQSLLFFISFFFSPSPREGAARFADFPGQRLFHNDVVFCGLWTADDSLGPQAGAAGRAGVAVAVLPVFLPVFAAAAVHTGRK